MANPRIISLSNSSGTIVWTTANGAVMLDGVPVAASGRAVPTTGGTHTLTVTGNGVTRSKNIGVNVPVAPSILDFIGGQWQVRSSAAEWQLTKNALAAAQKANEVLQTQLADALLNMKNLQAAAAKPADPATYVLDFNNIPQGPIGRFCRYAGGIDPNDPAVLLSRWKSACDRVVAIGGWAIVIWDAVTDGHVNLPAGTNGYVGDTRLSNIPKATWTEMFAYAASKKLATGIELTGGRVTGGWYASDDECAAATAEVVAYHKNTFGCTLNYWDSNDANNPLQLRKTAAACAGTIILAENHNQLNDMGKVALLWQSFGNGGAWWTWKTPDAGFTGRMALYANTWGQLRASEQAAALPWIRAALKSGQAQVILDCWYPVTIPAEWLAP